MPNHFDLLEEVTPIDRYAEKYPDDKIRPINDMVAAIQLCTLALSEDRKLTAAEHASFEYQNGDDIAGSNFGV